MNAINRIRFSVTKKPQVRSYGISRPITNHNRSFVQRKPVDAADYTDEWNATRESVQVINRIFALPGIKSLNFDTFEIEVTLASVISWIEVHDKIVQILKEEYFKGLEVEVQPGDC